MFATRAFGLVLWVVYGFFGGSLPVMIFSSVNLVLSITILVLTLRNCHVQKLTSPRRERPYALLAASAGPVHGVGPSSCPKQKAAVRVIIARLWRSSARFWKQAVRPRRRRGGAGKSKDRAGGVFAPSPRR